MVHPDIRTLSSLLKNATEKNHLALEASLQPHWSRMQNAANYARLLEVFYGFYAPLEKSIARMLPQDALPDMPERRKADWLLADLQTLGYNTVPSLTTNSPLIDSPAAAWGALYVLEGSTLGGRHICKLVRRELPDAPLRFFEGYRAETGPRWIRFQEALRAWGDSNDPMPVVASANQTFEKFRLWIKQTL
jgi:heme oxygenase (biliverdin-IX-beta and delta-forming)